jgi:hypothetical protein
VISEREWVLTTVAKVFDSAPTQNDRQGPSLTVGSPRVDIDFTLSNTPYVMAGLTVSTSPGLRPDQSPAMPSSWIISRATPRKESSYTSPLVPAAIGTCSVSSVEEVATASLAAALPTCCRVAMTATGMVNICARAPAMAPSESSTAVDKGESFAPGLVVRLM